MQRHWIYWCSVGKPQDLGDEDTSRMQCRHRSFLFQKSGYAYLVFDVIWYLGLIYFLFFIQKPCSMDGRAYFVLMWFDFWVWFFFLYIYKSLALWIFFNILRVCPMKFHHQYSRGGNSCSWIGFMDRVLVVSSHEYLARLT